MPNQDFHYPRRYATRAALQRAFGRWLWHYNHRRVPTGADMRGRTPAKWSARSRRTAMLTACSVYMLTVRTKKCPERGLDGTKGEAREGGSPILKSKARDYIALGQISQHHVADRHHRLQVIADNQGRNDVLVQLFGRQANLHGLWDGDLVDHAYPNPTALQEEVQAVLHTVRWQA